MANDPLLARASPLVDLERVAWTARIGLADRLYPAFSATARDGAADLHEAIAGGDLAAAARLAHRLRGVAVEVGASRLSVTLDDLEVALLDDDLGAAAFVLASLDDLIAATIAALERARSDARAPLHTE